MRLPRIVILSFLSGLQQAAGADDSSVCKHQTNTEQCPLLMDSIADWYDESCECHDFCHGVYLGCANDDDENSNVACSADKLVRGCTRTQQSQAQHRRQAASNVSFGNTAASSHNSGDGCAVGSFRPSIGISCIPCLSCGRNASPAVSCVKNAMDDAQCPCNAGYQSNGRGGCLPTTENTDSTGNTDSTVTPPAATNAVASAEECAAGTFRSPSGTCIACLSCGDSAIAKTTCVTNAADETQCGCDDGYAADGLGGCVPESSTESLVGSVVCEAGFYKSSPDPNAPCIPCLSCARNGFAKVECVQDATSPSQCGCDEGFSMNVIGGCVPEPSDAVEEPLNAAEEPSDAVEEPSNAVEEPSNVAEEPSDAVESSSAGGGVCATGFYKSSPDPNAPCIPCLTCARNGFARTNCVQNPTDPEQCGCFEGFTMNKIGGCLPVRSDAVLPEPTDAALPEPTDAVLPEPSDAVESSSLEDGACATGFYKSSPDPNAPCIPCLTCARNGFARTNCVQNPTDPEQCGCFEGFMMNQIGGCLPVRSDAVPPEPSDAVESGSLEDGVCATGFYKSSPDPNAPCIPCLSCARNGFAKVNCVQDATSPAQCGCNQGFMMNAIGGCLPEPFDAVESGSLEDGVCATGFYKSSPDPNAPCIPCLTCARNGFAKLNCVQDATDPAQCGCNEGFTMNQIGGCVPVQSDAVESGSLGDGVCATGSYKSSPDPNAPCIPCLSCARNGFAKVNCVQDATSPAQCGCNEGFTMNQIGGCLPVRSDDVESGSLEDGVCATGFYKSSPDPNAPCIPCLSCSKNGFPKLNCVQDATDPAQCGCNRGFTMNGIGGCLPLSSTVASSQEEHSGAANASVAMGLLAMVLAIYLH